MKMLLFTNVVVWSAQFKLNYMDQTKLSYNAVAVILGLFYSLDYTLFAESIWTKLKLPRKGYDFFDLCARQSDARQSDVWQSEACQVDASLSVCGEND